MKFQANDLFFFPFYSQAQKFRGADEIDSDDDLGEESLILDSPLDKIDTYQLFAATMHSKTPLQAQ